MGDDSRPVDGPDPDAMLPNPAGGSHGTAPPLSIAQLVQAHHQAVFRYAYRLVGSVPDAEDWCSRHF